MEKILVALSGGVDSAACAIILKKQGYDVSAATMKMFEDDEQSIQDAKQICEKLGMKHYIIDVQEEFENEVIKYFVEQYKSGKTPNPCVKCNKTIKFGRFYEFAKKEGFKYIATGHYANSEYNEEFNQYVISKPKNINKEQTYVLYGIEKNIIQNIIFPLAGFETKEEIRNIVKNADLDIISRKKDSQEICFIKNNDYVDFLKTNYNIEQKKGKIKTREGQVLGEHKGIINHTIGQRKGMGISSKTPLYIVEISKEKNEIIVGQETELYSNSLIAENCNFHIDINNVENITAKIRYGAKEDSVFLEQIGDNKFKIKFENPQRAITKGQSIVFYKGNTLIGGGIIA